MKKCLACRTEKPNSEFYWHESHGLKSRCKACEQERLRTRHARKAAATHEKRCLACLLVKPIAEFSCPKSLGKPLAVCKPCEHARHRMYRKYERDRRKLDAKQVQQRAELDERGVVATCPRCGAPEPRRSRASSIREWRHWGHRCQHGEPCPGADAVPTDVTQCAQCTPVQTEVLA